MALTIACIVPGAIRLHRSAPRHQRALDSRAATAAAAALPPLPARRCRRSLGARVRARRGSDYEDRDYVAFDDEEDWERQAAPVSAPGLGPILNTALRGLSAVSGRLGDLALQYAPADASPGAVRTAVNVGLVLLALSFVRSLLSFFLTVGTLILGAYVAVRVFGLDVPGISGSSDGGGGGGGGSRPPRSAAAQRPGRQQQQQGGGGRGRRLPDPRAKQSEFKGLLSSLGGDDDGLLDVRFERRQGGGGARDGGGGAKRRR